MVNEFRGACCWACDKECLAYDDSGICTSRGLICCICRLAVFAIIAYHVFPTQCPSMPHSTGLNDAGGCLRTGNQILDRWGFGDFPLWESYVGLVGTHPLNHLCLPTPCVTPCVTPCHTGCIVVMHCFGYFFLRVRKSHYMPLQQGGAKQAAKQA